MSTRKRWASFLVVLGATLLLSGCSDPAESYPSADKVVSALQTRSVECDDFERGEAATLVGDNATCSLDGDRVEILTFDGVEERDEWLKFGRLYGGELVLGPNWVLRTTAAGTAETLASALHGDLEGNG